LSLTDVSQYRLSLVENVVVGLMICPRYALHPSYEPHFGCFQTTERASSPVLTVLHLTAVSLR